MRYAIKVVDQHANKVVNDGDFVICEPLSSDEIEVDRLYYVQRTNGDLVEKTVRRVVRTGTGLQLSTVTNVASLINSVPYPHDGVTILALVVGKYASL